MSIIAGILSRQHEVPLSESTCDKLKSAVSRNPNDDVIVFRDHKACLVKIDVGAYVEAAFRVDNSGSVSMLAGEPLLDFGNDAAPGGRARDLEKMHHAFDSQQWELFSQTQGVYCAAHYDPRSETVTLIADKLGIRPIYYWVGREYVIFASALRVLESLAEIPKNMDLVAVTEIAILGCPVGSRTPYAEIRGLKAGEILRLTPDRASALSYWRWDSIKPSSLPEKEQLEEAYARFRKAVRRRLGRDTAVIASLSGGLDSRCVVAALRSESVQVHTLNFYHVHRSQDQVFALEFARQVGTIHQAVHVPAGVGAASFEKRVTDAWRSSPPAADVRPERPQMLWMGDGGSVGVGHVFIEREIVAALRAREFDKALAKYRNRFVPRLLKNGTSSAVAELVVEDIRAELEDLRFDDPGRSFHMFLMLYEQRYDLAQHFENLDLHRIEFHLPFFDGDFLASIVSAPVDLCLEHEFYADWLNLFPPAVRAVPWQAYPGHRPCPLPIPAGLAYQWDKAPPASEVEAKRHELLRVADQVLGADSFPDGILKKRFLRLARWMCKTGLRDGQGTIKAAEIYHRYWTACGGKFVAAPAITLEP
jgi:asparagine synthase (glutamine-hydrolysing)